jgi:hypothetical protein|tara:strand:+ start:398 stop:508 length:111 start_codon:yes stop_codon:yes gene_type:complete
MMHFKDILHLEDPEQVVEEQVLLLFPQLLNLLFTMA